MLLAQLEEEVGQGGLPTVLRRSQDEGATHLEVKIDKLQATMSALEGKLDRVLGGKGM